MQNTAAHLLTRQSHRRKGPAPLSLLPDMTLERGRVHEFCGPSRRVLALATGAAMTGPVLWIRPAWETTRLNPDGFFHQLAPHRVIFVEPARETDIAWSMEEALRSAAAPLVVAEMQKPPALTPVRRLHLAAERGGEAGEAPLGILLTPGAGGAAGVETRWSLAPAHAPRKVEAWTLTRLRARTAPPATFTVSTTDKGLALSTQTPAHAALTKA